MSQKQATQSTTPGNALKRLVGVIGTDNLSLMFALVTHALNGEGVVAVDRELFRAELAEGRLVAPFAQAVPTGYAYYLAIRPEDLQNTPVQLFRSWLVKHFTRPGGDPAPAPRAPAEDPQP